MINQKDFKCPQCNHSNPIDRLFAKWCDQCGWGVVTKVQETAPSLLERINLRLGKTHGQALLTKLINKGESRDSSQSGNSLKPELSFSYLLAISLSSLIHITTVAIAVFGIWLIWVDWPNLLLISLGLAALSFVWFLHPRLPKAPDDSVSPRDFPVFFRVVNEMSEKLGGKPIASLVISNDINASYYEAGWQRKPVLSIGLPLWTILDHQQRLAVSAHELSHGVNGDAQRNIWIGSALGALHEWLFFLYPPDLGWAGRLIMWLISRPIALLQLVLAQSLWQDHQKAEYYADYLASRLVGTTAMIDSLQKVSRAQHFERFLLENAYSGDQSGSDLMDRLKDYFENLPPREIERIQRANKEESSRLDNTHPPTAYRIEFLQAHQTDDPSYDISRDQAQAMDKEINSLKQLVGEKILMDFLN